MTHTLVHLKSGSCTAQAKRLARKAANVLFAAVLVWSGGALVPARADEESAQWSYDSSAKTITDGVWTLNVSADATARTMTVNSIKANPSSGAINLAKPVVDGDGNVYSVTAIAGSAFKSKTCLTAIHLPETLQSIGGSAFLKCTALATVEPFLPESVTSIGVSAFDGCSALAGDLVIGSEGGAPTELQISNGNGWQFNLCSSITSIRFRSATAIPANVCLKCSSLTNVVLDAAETVGSSAFNACTALKTVRLSGTLQSIGGSAFLNCKALATVEPFLPESVTRIGASAFDGCSALAGDLVIGSEGGAPTELQISNGNGCQFNLCSSITSIRFRSATAIPAQVCYKCSSLTNVVLDVAETVGSSAFNACTALKTVRLSGTLQSIGGSAFLNCTALATVEPFLPESVTSIGVSAFDGCSALAGDLVIGSEDGAPTELLTSNEKGYQFCACSSITSIRFRSATALPAQVCYKCSSLTNVVLDAAETVGGSAFNSDNKISDFFVNRFAAINSTAFNYGPAAYGMRFHVAEGNADWDNWVAENVTPWDELTEDQKGKFAKAFPEATENPVGLINKNGAQPQNQWAFRWNPYVGEEQVVARAEGNSGGADGSEYGIFLYVDYPPYGEGCSYKWSADGGTTWVDQEPRFSEIGTYEVRCRISAEGFRSAEVSAMVVVHADQWAYDPGSKTITYGAWTLNVSADATARTMSISSIKANPSSGAINLAKPVVDGDGNVYSVTAIAGSAFKSKTCLTAIHLPETLQSIGGSAFLNCTALATVEPFLPESVTSIGVSAFEGCSALAGDLVIGSEGGAPTELLTSNGNGYQFYACSSITSIRFRSATALPAQVCYKCSSLTNVVLDAAETVGSSAFNACTALKTVRISGTLQSIGGSAFLNCKALATVEPFLPESVTRIGASAFDGCSALAGDLVIGSEGGAPTELLTSNGNGWQFNLCSSITSIRFRSATAIPANVCYKCSSLTNVVLDAAETVGSSAFNSDNKISDFFVNRFAAINSTAFNFGPAAYGMRFHVAKGNADWDNWVATNVTRWAELTEDQRGKFAKAFPGETKHPVGLINKNGVQPQNQWACRWRADEIGFMVIIR